MAEKSTKHFGGFAGETAFIDCLIHEQHPAIAGRLSNGERGVSGPKGRVAAFLQVVLGAAKAKCQEHPQPLFSPREILWWIHRSEQIIGGNPAIEGGCELPDTVCAKDGMQVVFSDGWCGGCFGHGSSGWAVRGWDDETVRGWGCVLNHRVHSVSQRNTQYSAILSAILSISEAVRIFRVFHLSF